MPKSRIVLWIGVTVAYLIYFTLVWVLAGWVLPGGASLWLLRLGLWGLGLVGAAVILWYFAGPSTAEQGGGDSGADGDELEATLAAAAARLASARSADARALRSLPMIVVFGPEGSTKTSLVVHSGLEPDLLAGEVFHGDRIGPTPGINVWYSHRTILLEAGGKLQADGGRWTQLIRRVRPRTLKASLTGRAQAPRAAVVCFSCEELLKPGSAQTATAAARELRAKLIELAQGFGVQLPVYVAFTKADRIPCFPEFTGPVSREEAQQVFGTTLRWPGRATAGLHADREFQRLNTAFERLAGSLAAKRVDLLAREADPERQAGVYEFPRELRKLMPAAVQFLVDLCRPSQLDVSPVLRGFYFTGVRAVVISDAAPVPGPAAPAPGRIGAATQVFDAAAQQAYAAPAPGPAGTRKVPQWLFLSTLFRDVLLRDAAPGAVAHGARTVAMLRRAGLATAVAVALFGSLWSTVQYAKNDRAVAAARELATVIASDNGLPTPETLSRLETLRAHLERLSTWGRWWLYKGRGLYPDLRRVYADRFDAILLGPARVSLLRSLDSLPDSPNATAQYSRAYELLEAYLMTTSHPDKLSTGFIVPVLMERWLNGRPMDPAPRDLARRQFEFYASRLCRGACGTDADERVVARTRAFLVKFTGAERIYQLMISEASAKAPSVQFHRRFPAAGAYVVDNYEVPGAFTPAGYAAMQDALRHFDRFFQADDWVLGAQQRASVDRAKLVEDLRAMYVAEYVRRWQDFLAAGSVVSYGSARDAAQKLAQLGGNQSPLLQLLSLVSQNTQLDSQTIGGVFQPVHAVMPPGAADRFVVDANQPYVGALSALQATVTQAASAPPGAAEGLVSQTMDAARSARAVVGQVALKFSVTGDAAIVGTRVRTLLEAPIDRVEHLLGRLPAAAVNDRGAAFCRALGSLLARYPLRPDASVEATLPDVSAIFEPANGALWTFYAEALQNLLVKQGTQYLPKLGAPLTPSPTFVRFFNRLAAVTDALWPAGATQPQFDFTIKLLPAEGVPTATFSMDGQVHRFTRTFTPAERYTWVGSMARDVRLSGDVRGRDETLLGFDGTWALFKLLQRARWQTIGVTSIVQWTVPAQGQNVSLGAELNLGAARPILKGDYFAGLSCVSQVVQ